MGIVLGQLGVMQSPLWSESEPSTAIRSHFREGAREWEMVLWVSASGNIEGHCGGKVSGHNIRGIYRRSDDICVRIGGRIFGETLHLFLHEGAHIFGQIGGIITGCRVEAELHDNYITGWLRAKPFHQQRIYVQLMDIEAPVALMISCIACYFGYFVYNYPDLTY
jgi:hypothetical protein